MDIFKTLGLVVAIGIAGWFVYDKVIKSKTDTPAVNPQNMTPVQRQIYDKGVEYLMNTKYKSNYAYY